MFGESLSNLPQLDKGRYIETYVHTQKKFEKHYASDNAAATLDASTTTTARDVTHPPKHSLGCGFETPRIQARVARRRSSLENIPEKRTTKRAKETRQAIPQEKPKETQRNKEKVVRVDSSEEQDKRLQERRERKRKKREITRTPDHEDESSDESNEAKKKKDKRSVKCPAGLALMHGFTATNVGKDRITVKPSLHLGVFSKGKASQKAKTEKSTRTQFSEAMFLNNNHKQNSTISQKEQRERPERRCKSRKKANTDEDSSGTEGLKPPAKQRRSVAPICQDRKVPKTPTSAISSSSTNASPKKTWSNVGSATWDIEMDVSPSEVDAFTRETSHPVTIDTRPLLVKAQQISAPRDTASRISNLAEPQNSIIIPMDKNCTPSDLSLGPSQSASQQGDHLAALPPQPKMTTSKYFKSAQPYVVHVQEPVCSPPRLHCPEPRIPEHHSNADNSVLEYRGFCGFPDEAPSAATRLVDKFDTDPSEANISDHGFLPISHQDWDSEYLLPTEEVPPLHSGMLGYQEGAEEYPSDYYVDIEAYDDLGDIPDQAFGVSEDWDYCPQETIPEDLDDLLAPIEDLCSVDSGPLDLNKETDWDESYCDSRPPAGNTESYESETLELESNISCQLPEMDESEEPEDESMVDAYPFLQGRALLVGISPEAGRSISNQECMHRLPREEVDVARSLTRHWYPQRW